VLSVSHHCQQNTHRRQHPQPSLSLVGNSCLPSPNLQQRQIDRQTDRQTDKQTDRLTDRLTWIVGNLRSVNTQQTCDLQWPLRPRFRWFHSHLFSTSRTLSWWRRVCTSCWEGALACKGVSEMMFCTNRKYLCEDVLSRYNDDKKSNLQGYCGIYHKVFRFTTAHGHTGQSHLHPLFCLYRVPQTCRQIENGQWECPPRIRRNLVFWWWKTILCDAGLFLVA